MLTGSDADNSFWHRPGCRQRVVAKDSQRNPRLFNAQWNKVVNNGATIMIAACEVQEALPSASRTSRNKLARHSSMKYTPVSS
jgi:hypothetical protein